jgi:hypothetical protein
MSESNPLADMHGKMIYQRTFYRLSPGSDVAKPNALVVEERVRFRPDPENDGYILPYGPRTFILRQGTEEDEITDELYRMNEPGETHNGSGAQESTIATILFLASNPQMCQGDVLQIACGDGIAGLLGCIGAGMQGKDPKAMKAATGSDEDESIFTLPNRKDSILPKRLHHLTLTDENPSLIQKAYDTLKHSHLPPSKVSLKELQWSSRDTSRSRQYASYHAVIGSDVDFSYPTSKELARMVANSLLPSDATAAGKAATFGKSFGGLGMDDGPATAQVDPDSEVDPNIPPAFVHVCSDRNDNVRYLRQYLEKGFKMNVSSGYLKLEKLKFVYQLLEHEKPEAEIEDLDLELQEDSSRVFQSLVAVHHPDYAAGMGEYFFPLETGEYESGSRSTQFEPEEGGSPW